MRSFANQTLASTLTGVGFFSVTVSEQQHNRTEKLDRAKHFRRPALYLLRPSSPVPTPTKTLTGYTDADGGVVDRVIVPQQRTVVAGSQFEMEIRTHVSGRLSERFCLILTPSPRLGRRLRAPCENLSLALYTPYQASGGRGDRRAVAGGKTSHPAERRRSPGPCYSGRTTHGWKKFSETSWAILPMVDDSPLLLSLLGLRGVFCRQLSSRLIAGVCGLDALRQAWLLGVMQ